jgi:outer membrane protein TolC
MRSRSHVTHLLLLAALTAVASADDTTPQPEQRNGRRVVRLRVADVGRLALRNSPEYASRVLDPHIAWTAEREARGEFDPLFAARGAAGETQSPVFFDPSSFGPGSSSGQSILEEDTWSGSASVSRTEKWGGVWRVGYDAESTKRGGASSIASLQPRYDGALSLGYTHPLLRNAGEDVRLSRMREAARLAEQASDQLERTAELTVAGAETLYWELVGARSDREVRRKSVEVAKELLSVAEARLAAKTGIPVEVAEARAGLARREVDLIAADTLVDNISDSLRELVLPFAGENPDLDLSIEPAEEPTQTPLDLPRMPEAAELDAALRQRADVRSAVGRADAARLAELRARNATESELNAFGTGALVGLGSGFSESADRIEDRRTFSWELGLEYTIPLGNNVAEARLDRAARERDRSDREVAALRNTVVRELREATRNVRSAAERIAASGRARTAAAEQLRAERARLGAGRSTPFQVLEVEEDLSEAESSEIQSRVDFEKARVALAAATGVLLVSRDLTGLVGGE